MEFSYRRGDHDGPERWGLIRRDWATCSFGRRQSPIHLSAAAVAGGGYHRRAGRLLLSYRPAAASLVNRGHDIMVRFDGDAGGVVVDGEAYTLRQMHWHSPSEHAVDGRRYDLELHMLHQSETRDGRYAVVAQLFDIGHRRDATLDMLEPYIRRVANKRKGHEVEIDDDVDPRWPVEGSGVYYRCGACRGGRWSSCEKPSTMVQGGTRGRCRRRTAEASPCTTADPMRSPWGVAHVVN
uniref:Carbonic anhydrase n=1 Tax=Oryza punctata TaxID=4537 RepID=C0JA40_ORYPU|nr:unknown [Oryza punctata]